MAFIWQLWLVSVVHGRDVSIYTRRGNQPNKSKLALYNRYFTIIVIYNSCSEVTRRSASVIKVGVVDIDVRVSSHLKEELTWAIDKRLRVISTIMLFKKQ